MLCQWASAAYLFAFIHISQTAGRWRARALWPMVVAGFHGGYRRCGQSQDWTGIQCGSANIQEEPVQLVVGVLVPLRSFQVGPCLARMFTFSGFCMAKTDTHAAFRSIDRLAPHRSKAQSQSSECRPGDFCTSILLNDCSSGASGYLSPPWRLVTRRAWNLHVANFACGCEDWIFYRLKIHSFFDKLAESRAGTFPTPHFEHERG